MASTLAEALAETVTGKPIVLGRVTGFYGVQGWVRLHPFGDDPLSWSKIKTWWLAEEPEAPAGTWREMALAGCRNHSGTVVVKFSGVDTRDAAEALVGVYVGCMQNDLPKTGKGEYYWAELEGMAVENLKGEPLGKVLGLLETGAHDVLRVGDVGEVAAKGKSEERLLPFVEAVVKDVDRVAGVIRVEWERDW